MIEMQLSEAAAAIPGTIRGPDVRFVGCSTDTRQLRQRELFIALRGERFDGHDFVTTAQRDGAAAVMIDSTDGIAAGTRALLVTDTRWAIGRLAAVWRQKFELSIIAVTGSNGKTTVKELIAAILSETGPVLATAGNLNNEIGVPLSLFRLDQDHRHAVIELGANHPGEIAALTEIVRPAVAVVTQCAPAHLQGFGSVAGVARGKGEIYEGLPGSGTAVINLDDDYAGTWRESCAARRQITFGLGPGADVTASRIDFESSNGNARFVLHYSGQHIPVSMNIPGIHNVHNALAAAACCFALSVPIHQVGDGLQAVHSIPGRLHIRRGTNNSRVIDDTYNANPGSLAAALKLMEQFSGTRILVLGDMGELGHAAESLHRQAGEAARRHSIDRLYTFGTLSEQAARSFGEGGSHFEEMNQVINAVDRELTSGVTVLVKGSRAMSMEKIVDAITVQD